MKFRALMLCSSIVLVAFSPAAHAKLSAPETKMVATVDAEYERSIALLERLVNQNSGTMNFPGVKTVGDMMRAELEPLGFKVQWIDMAKAVDAWRIFPRLFLTVYIILLYKCVIWYMNLGAPTMEQSGLISIVVGAGAAWFGLYTGTSKK